MPLRKIASSNAWKTWVGGVVFLSLLASAWAGTFFEQSKLIPVGGTEMPNVIPVGVKASEDEGFAVDAKSKAVTLRAKWGSFLILFPETTLSQVGDRITVKLTGTFENLDSSARGLRFAVANIADPSKLVEAVPSMDSPLFVGTTAYGWNFRQVGANNEKSEIFRKSPETPNLLSSVGGANLGFSREPLNLAAGMPQKLTVKLEKTGPAAVSLTYDFEGITSLTVVDSSPDNFSFNSFILFLSSSTKVASIKLENFSVSLDKSKS